MNDDDTPIDFSALNPARDSQRWEQLIERVATCAMNAPPLVNLLWLAMARTGRGLFAFSAVLAVCAWLPTWVQGPAVESVPTEHPIAEWARRGEIPPDADVLGLLQETWR
ncbi:MAG: hypothetical protein K1X64_12220 [Myxococcaceae bacterium]|nr:hypothetical protein [Myxococcaceae bacterium]